MHYRDICITASVVSAWRLQWWQAPPWPGPSAAPATSQQGGTYGKDWYIMGAGSTRPPTHMQTHIDGYARSHPPRHQHLALIYLLICQPPLPVLYGTALVVSLRFGVQRRTEAVSGTHRRAARAPARLCARPPSGQPSATCSARGGPAHTNAADEGGSTAGRPADGCRSYVQSWLPLPTPPPAHRHLRPV